MTEEKEIKEEKKGFFSKLKSFFTKEKKQEVLETKEEVGAEPTIAPKPSEELPKESKPNKECFWCREYIYEGDRWSKQQNKWFHRTCYKKFLQAGLKGS